MTGSRIIALTRGSGSRRIRSISSGFSRGLKPRSPCPSTSTAGGSESPPSRIASGTTRLGFLSFAGSLSGRMGSRPPRSGGLSGHWSACGGPPCGLAMAAGTARRSSKRTSITAGSGTTSSPRPYPHRIRSGCFSTRSGAISSRRTFGSGSGINRGKRKIFLTE